LTGSKVKGARQKYVKKAWENERGRKGSGDFILLEGVSVIKKKVGGGIISLEVGAKMRGGVT